MNYELIKATPANLEELIKYKLSSILDYASSITEEEREKIKKYVRTNVPKQIDNYQMIVFNDQVIGCLLITKHDDGVLLDEIYIKPEYQNRGIGTDIIGSLRERENIAYLWVYKENEKAIKLYKKMGFKIVLESSSRYYMKCGGENMEEMIDVLDEHTGEKTGEIISKREAHQRGIWHGSIHVLIVSNDKKRTLLQRRSAGKNLYLNMWDIAVGGHISAGEDDITSAKRELEEELAINVDTLNMERIDRIMERFINNGVISNEYVSVFVLYADIPISSLELQEEEVSEAKWCTKDELNRFIENKEIIPHDQEFTILNDILED
ncbi:MAG: GNAT family N-acetyltransferase [Bacilli bacterium]|nr:GNAT family N-acetyltransferase [Bacilli bacterium]